MIAIGSIEGAGIGAAARMVSRLGSGSGIIGRPELLAAVLLHSTRQARGEQTPNPAVPAIMTRRQKRHSHRGPVRPRALRYRVIEIDSLIDMPGDTP